MPMFNIAVLTSFLWLSDVTNAFTLPVRRTNYAVRDIQLKPINQRSKVLQLFMSSRAQMTRDLYNVLGVSRTANNQEIRQAYRKMAKRYHPDSNPSSNTIELLKEVNRAYEVLRNTEMRRNYDLYGFEGIGTSASSDAEEMDNRRRSPGVRYDPYATSRSQHYYEKVKVHDGPYSDYSEVYGSQRHHPRQDQFHTSSDTFFGQKYGCESHNYNNKRPTGEARTKQNTQSTSRTVYSHEVFNDANYIRPDNIGTGATSHSFFQDIDKNGRPRGARKQQPTTNQPSAWDVSPDDFFGQRDSFQNAESVDNGHSFFGDIDNNGRPRGTRRNSNNSAAQSTSTSRDTISPDDWSFGGQQNHPSERPYGYPDSTNTNSHDFFQDIDKTGKSRGCSTNSYQSSFFQNPECHDHFDVQSPSQASSTTTATSGEYKSTTNFEDPFFSAGRTAKTKKSGYKKVKKDIGIRAPKVGGDIRVELIIDVVTQTYGGDENVIVTRLEPCDACQGNGATTATSVSCAKCGGQGLKRKRKEIKVNVPPHTQDGSMIRLTGDGDAGPTGGPPGDLYVTIRVNQDTTTGPRGEFHETSGSSSRSIIEDNTANSTVDNVEVPRNLNEAEQELLNKLRDLLDLGQQQNNRGGGLLP